jgi:hypothetical protein
MSFVENDDVVEAFPAQSKPGLRLVREATIREAEPETPKLRLIP